ncbi:unnamed protein product [Prorocentrum cordatum]|uniref:Uncharacterized protein n=1 Tax=Prorocentrum cordatum TaxID=2364126 RepID=A0ABN9PY37_9DINO|nr:unnamed protein product [Polarella glacialis]
MAPADGRAAESGSVEHGRGAGVLYCRLVVRGVVRATEAAVVDLGAEQTIVACPAACAPARSGGWAEPAEEPALGNHACPCAGGGPCAVVFYCLDAAALLTAGIPEALRFRGADGAPAVPDADLRGGAGTRTSRGGADLWRGGARAPAGPRLEPRIGACARFGWFVIQGRNSLRSWRCVFRQRAFSLNFGSWDPHRSMRLEK